MLTCKTLPVANGSAIVLYISGITSNITVYRAPVVSGVIGTYVAIESLSTNNPLIAQDSVVLDMGSTLPGPLPSGSYIYQLNDTATGSILLTTDIITLQSVLVLNRTDMTEIMIKLTQGGVNNTVLPGTFKKPQVYHAMPNVGLPPLPIITVNQHLFETTEVPIGQNVATYDITNSWNIETIAEWTYMFTVITANAPEREFYRDLVISLLHSFMGTPMNIIGKNITHKVMATSGQKTQDMNTPGFFWADIMFKFSGTFSVEINNMPNIINDIGFEVTSTIYDYPTEESVTDDY